MKYSVEVAGSVIVVEVDEGGVTVDGKRVEVTLHGVSGSAQRRLSRGRVSRGFTAVRGEETGAWRLSLDGARVDALVLDERARVARTASRAAGGGPGSGTLKAPMPGLVVRVLVAEGDQVEAGQGLVVVEAMKMENELKAPKSGTVSKLAVEKGSKIEKGAVLLEIS